MSHKDQKGKNRSSIRRKRTSDIEKPFFVKIRENLNEGHCVFLAFVVFKIVLDFVCTNAMTMFSNSLTSDPNLGSCVISWVFYLLQLAVISYLAEKKHSLTTVLYLLLFMINGVGYYTLFGRSKTMEFEFFLLVNVFWFVFSAATLLLPAEKATEKPAIRPINTTEKAFFWVVAAASLIISGVYGGFRFGVAFEDVYEYRMNLNMPTLVGYVFRFCSGVFLPYLFIRFLMTKKWIPLIATMILAVFLYSVDGLKTNFILYVVIIGVYLVNGALNHFGKRTVNLVTVVLALLSAGLLTNYIIWEVSGKTLFLDEAYRVLCIPCGISSNYYRFIVDNEPLLLRESIMRYFCESPYSESISYLVTDIVTEHGEAVANTGLIGDAYANFKLLGICVYPVAYATVIWLWQQVNKNEISTMTVAIGFIMLWNAINISFFTWLLTGGVLAYFFIHWILKFKIVLPPKES